jgi:hypothetical protein
MDALDHTSVSKVVHCMLPLLLILTRSQIVYCRLAEWPKIMLFVINMVCSDFKSTSFLLISNINLTLFSTTLKEKKSVNFHDSCYKNLCLWS